MQRNILWCMGMVWLAMILAGPVAIAGVAESPALPAEALLADPWVAPSRTPAETQARVAELKQQYAPYLRSLPEKLETRQRQPINGAWRSHLEVEDSSDGRRPAVPGWFRDEFKDSAWESTTVPEWRWAQHKNKKTGRCPVSCILWYRTRFAAPPPPAGRRTWLCFDGVDWEAEVWLNGTFLGWHKGYYEPFRFDVTKLLKKENTLAVRVIDGPAFGEPHSFEGPLENVPCLPASNQRFVRDRAKSCLGMQPKGEVFLGSGFGIHREVYLETTGESCVTAILARGNPATSQAAVTVETDGAERDLDVEVQLLPENFEGAAYTNQARLRLVKGPGRHSFTLSAPGAKAWWPAEPNLYRCRVTLRESQTVVDAKDVLFGFRSFGLVSKDNPLPGQPQGRFVLNGRPLFLRGTNLGAAMNGYWYWNEPENMLMAALMLKAANFNAVRSCQYVCFPEVRELFDRLGIMSEQDQGHGSEIIYDTSATLAETGTILARTCYNNPGVVLLSFANETHHDATAVVSNALAIDPERIIIPASGGSFSLKDPRLSRNAVHDLHLYEAWYKSPCFIWKSANPFEPRSPVATMGEYGGEALDAYETMRDHYPPGWGPPPRPDEDRLWGAVQVRMGSAQQQFGFRGATPTNLLQHIAASQTYQADLLAEATKGIRLSPRTFTGYFQYHFLDGMPARWPKSIVSHDLRPKQGYFEMAQINQPLVPLYRLVDRGQGLELWVVNDLPLALEGCRLGWTITAGPHRLAGVVAAAVPAQGALQVGRVDLKSLPATLDVLDVRLVLEDARGRTISEYGRGIYRNYAFIEQCQRAWDAQDVGYWSHESVSVNVALHKPITATSAASGTPADLAVDGKSKTVWRAAGALPQALTIDLGQDTPLCGARLVWEGEQAGQVTLAFSDDGRVWKPASGAVREASDLPSDKAPTQRRQYFAFQGAGRYVRVTVCAGTVSGPVGVADLALYRKKGN